MSTLFSWLGTTDVNAFKNDNPHGAPIPSMLMTGKFEKAVILSNWPAEKRKERDPSQQDCENCIRWLKQITGAQIQFDHIFIPNPIDLRSIYLKSVEAVEDYSTEYFSEPDIAFNISSGTWAMSIAWTLIAKTKFLNVPCWASAEDIEPLEIAIPFEISHELYKEELSKSRLGILDSATIGKNEFYNKAVFKGEAMLNLIAQAVRAAEHPYPVLITGDMGTEKVVFAREIHENDATRSKKGRFIEVACNRDYRFELDRLLFGNTDNDFIMRERDNKPTPSLVEQAEFGTLYLEDVDALGATAQSSLLDLIQTAEREYSKRLRDTNSIPRIVATSRKDLFQEVLAGRFSEQLYFKLSSVSLRIPNLEEREDDIITIADNMLEQVNELGMQGAAFTRKHFSPAALDFIKNRKWPGNLFELETTIKRAALNTSQETISEADMLASTISIPEKEETGDSLLNKPLGDDFKIKEVLDAVAKHYLVRAKEQSGGNASAAYKLVGLGNYQTFLNWYDRYVEKKSPK